MRAVPPSHTRHFAGHYISAGLVCSDVLFLCLFARCWFFVVVFWGKSHIALKSYVDKDCPKCQVRTGMVCRLGDSTAQNGPCAPVELVSCGGPGKPSRKARSPGRR